MFPQGDCSVQTRWISCVPVAGLAASLVLVIATHRSLFWAMAAGSVIAAVSAYRYLSLAPQTARQETSTVARIAGYARGGVSRIANVVIFILLVNAMTAVWFSSGTIQGLVYYGLAVVRPSQVMAAGLTISTLVSLVLGSSVGTASTVGVAVMGMAKALGIPLAPVAGAIMSGAVFGDRVSFLSSIFHLTVDQTGSDQKRASKRILATGAVAWTMAFLAYLAMGAACGSGSLAEGLRTRAQYQAALSQSASIGIWVVAPPAVVILLSAKRVPVRTCLLSGLAAGVAVAIGYQGKTAAQVIGTALWGFRQQSVVPELTSLLRSGGIAGTKNTVLLMFFAGIYTGITELSGMMEQAIRPLTSRVMTRISFLITTMAVSVISAALASNQSMSVILPARLMEAKRKEIGVPPEEFAGAISDSGVAAAGIIPWNVMAVICSQSLQVSPSTYAPYSFFLIALPAVGLLRAFASSTKEPRGPSGCLAAAAREKSRL